MILRIFGVYTSSMAKYDPLFGAVLIPNMDGVNCQREFCVKAHTNSQGFIDDDFNMERVPGKKRVLLMGDSQMEALQVPVANATHRVLEGLFSENGQDVEVFNLGVSGYGPTEYLLALEKYAPMYRPDLVVFAVMVSNDLRNVNPVIEQSRCKPYFSIDGGSLTLVPVPDDCYTKLHSKILFHIRLRVRVVDFIFRAIEKLRQTSKYRGDENFIPMEMLVYDPSNEDYRKSFLITDKILEGANAYCEDNGINLLVLTLSTNDQINPKRWQAVLDTYPALKNKEIDLLYPDKRIKQSCDDNGIECFNLVYQLKEYSEKNGVDLHFFYDSHWNEEGHRKGAEIIYQYIVSKGLLSVPQNN